MTPQAFIDAFFNTGQIMAGQVQPYAMHLLGLLVLVEVLTIAITWMMGSDDPPEIAWRIIRLLFYGGFGFWWLTSAFALGTTVIGSFDQIGRNIANAPGGLAPSQFFDIAIRLVKILWNAPSSGRLLPSIGLDILEGLLIIIIMVLLGLIGAIAAFSLVATMLIIGPGSIFVSFMVCRFTSSLSENYFIWLVRTGGLLLGFYVVLDTIQQLVAKWYTALAGVCGPIAALLPVPALGGAPTATAATPCTAPIGVNDLITLFFCVLLVAIVGIGVPFILAAMAGHGVHLGLENLASAKYLGGGAIRNLSTAIRGLSHQVSRMMHQNQQQTTLNQRMEAGAAAAARTSSSAPTTPLRPPPSSPPSSGGWNGRPSGPPISPPPNGGSGSGGAALEYYPGRPGAQTRAEAVDITKLQKR
jgi:P-type conjugative transfer protein TrbL